MDDGRDATHANIEEGPVTHFPQEKVEERKYAELGLAYFTSHNICGILRFFSELAFLQGRASRIPEFQLPPPWPGQAVQSASHFCS